jgi:hypothetical protein
MTMTQPIPESGWENPDHHPDLTQRARPMFGPDGKPVTKAPEPVPLTPAERAVFVSAVVDSNGRVASVTAGARVAPLMEARLLGTVTRVRSLAADALENPSPAAWAVALAEIVRELDA